MSTHDEFEAAADTVEGLLPKLARKARGDCLEYTVGFLREAAATAKREADAEAELDTLAERLAFVWRDAAPFPDGNEWRAVAREAMAVHAETQPVPSTIPADATGLNGKRARIVGPVRTVGNVPAIIVQASVGDLVTINMDIVTAAGNVEVGADVWIAASSLALIPDEPEAVPEPPVGTRLRDKRGNVWERRDAAHKFCWSSDGITPPYTFDLLMQHHGPLHQVWERYIDVPQHVKVMGRNGSWYMPLATDDVAVRTAVQNVGAPFVAVAEFGANQ